MRKALPRPGRFGRDGGGRSLVDFLPFRSTDTSIPHIPHAPKFSDASSIRSFLLNHPPPIRETQCS
jgi:hypothetical protein